VGDLDGYHHRSQRGEGGQEDRIRELEKQGNEKESNHLYGSPRPRSNQPNNCNDDPSKKGKTERLSMFFCEYGVNRLVILFLHPPNMGDGEVEAVSATVQEEEKKRTIGKYDMGEVLGEGAFCKVGWL